MRYPGRGREHAKNVIGWKDSPKWAVHYAHPGECQIDFLKVGIGVEVAYPKNVSRRRIDGSGRTNYHSNRLDEPKNFASGHNSITSKLGKR